MTFTGWTEPFFAQNIFITIKAGLERALAGEEVSLCIGELCFTILAFGLRSVLLG